MVMFKGVINSRTEAEEGSKAQGSAQGSKDDRAFEEARRKTSIEMQIEIEGTMTWRHTK